MWMPQCCAAALSGKAAATNSSTEAANTLLRSSGIMKDTFLVHLES